MIKLLVNGLAASAGGGLTYLRNVIPHLARRSDVHAHILVSPELRSEFDGMRNVTFARFVPFSTTFRRFYQEQADIPKLIRESGADVLISAGNFAVWNSPVPQILLSRNSLYTSRDFLRDVHARGDYTIWIDTLVKGWFARRSILRAEVAVAPSVAFANDLKEWSGKTVVAIHHGFDPDAFTRDSTPLPGEVQAQLDGGKDALRLLFVSHYNYYRNFETLFRAIPILKQRLKPRPVKLYLTCRLTSDANPGSYRTEAAASLVNDLRTSQDIVELGAVPYSSLHQLYRGCNVYVTPAYAESFAHPLVEAMSSGLPVVASDLPVHREICGNAALFFPRFSPEDLAENIFRLHESRDLADQLVQNGSARSMDFNWSRHVDSLLELAKVLAGAAK